MEGPWAGAVVFWTAATTGAEVGTTGAEVETAELLAVLPGQLVLEISQNKV